MTAVDTRRTPVPWTRRSGRSHAPTPKGRMSTSPRHAEPGAADDGAQEKVVNALRAARRQALSVTELAARLRGEQVDVRRLDAALAALERDGRVAVLAHPAPDVHLEGTDLRTVGLADDASSAARERARRAADAHWEDVIRTFLASHRCG